jgi:two-component system CheB/CheR fusion protein
MALPRPVLFCDEAGGAQKDHQGMGEKLIQSVALHKDTKRQLARIDAALAGLGADGLDPFAAAVRATRMPILVTNPRRPDSPVVFVNDAFCRLTGYARAEILGRNCRFLQGKDTDQATVSRLRDAVRAEAQVELDIRNHRKNGEGFWNRLHIVPVHDARGELVYYFASQIDITVERERLLALEANNKALLDERVARQDADRASAAKSRFLAVASHDIRQPIQTLVLLQGLLAKMVHGQPSETLVTRMGHTLDAMSGMLGTLLDISQIEAGAISPSIVPCKIDKILSGLREAFIFEARTKGLSLRVVPCSLTVQSDPHLLEQMIRNLLANAMKYTSRGKILLGCRRHGDRLAIEIWDTGIGIPSDQQVAIFQAYHQVGNAARDTSQGVGLGLSIVQRLGSLLNHQVRLRSSPGTGSVFAIDVMRTEPCVRPTVAQDDAATRNTLAGDTKESILLVDSDRETSDLLKLLLVAEGYEVKTARDGAEALQTVANERFRPSLILADFKASTDVTNQDPIAALRARMQMEIPAIILTSDGAVGGGGGWFLQNCLQLTKPVKSKDLKRNIQRLIAQARPTLLDGRAGPPQN